MQEAGRDEDVRNLEDRVEEEDADLVPTDRVGEYHSAVMIAAKGTAITIGSSARRPDGVAVRHRCQTRHSTIATRIGTRAELARPMTSATSLFGMTTNTLVGQ